MGTGGDESPPLTTWGLTQTIWGLESQSQGNFMMHSVMSARPSEDNVTETLPFELPKSYANMIFGGKILAFATIVGISAWFFPNLAVSCGARL